MQIRISPPTLTAMRLDRTPFTDVILVPDPSMDPELADSDPQQLGDWRVLSKLGEGGMGSVFLAERSGRHAAIKTLHPTLAHGADASERFQREYSAALRVRSPYVAEIIDADLVGARPFLAIEYVSGLTLEDYIAQNGALSGEELTRFGHQLAVGIEAMHDVAVTHRDIKPSNVIMTRRGPVIIDFGIALLGEAPQLTATNQIMGSPGWTSPEQLLGDRVGTPADVFGWGALMQFAATGSNPFGTGSPQAMMYRIAHGTPSDHSIQGPVGQAITRALSQAPGDRPSVAELLAATVTDAAVDRSAHRSQTAPRATDPPMPAASLKALTAAVALLALAVVGLIAWQVLGTSDDRVEQAQSTDQTEVTAPASAAGLAAAGEGQGRDEAAAAPATPLAATEGKDDATGAADLRENRDQADEPTAGDAQSSPAPLGDVESAEAQRDGNVISVNCPDGKPAALATASGWGIEPGDIIELARGCTFVSPLRITTSGRADSPITVRSPAAPEDLPRAVITNDPNANVGALIRLDASHVHINTLDLVAQSIETSPTCATSPFGWVVGVAIGEEMVGNVISAVTATGGYAGVHIGSGASDNTVSDSRFEANTMLNDTSGANGIEIFGDRNTVTRNVFVDSAACGEGAAVEVFGGSHNTIVANRGVDNQSFVELHGEEAENTMGNSIRRNIQRSSVPGATFALMRARNVEGLPNEISHNTMYLDGAGYLDGAAEPAGLRCVKPCVDTEAIFANNIVYAIKASTGSGSYTGGSNLIWASDGQVSDRLELTGTPNIMMDPQLEDPFGESFVPRVCSPAIDAAPAEVATTDLVDAVGNPVPVGAGADIGAIEAQGPISCAG